MEIKTIFRIAIVSEWVIAIIAVISELLFVTTLPDLLFQYQLDEAKTDLTILSSIGLGIDIFLLILVLISSIGLFFFLRWARHLYFWTTLSGTILMLKDNPIVLTSFGSVLDEISLMITGFIIASMWFSDVKYEFVKIKTEPISSGDNQGRGI